MYQTRCYKCKVEWYDSMKDYRPYDKDDEIETIPLPKMPDFLEKGWNDNIKERESISHIHESLLSEEI